MMNTITVSCPNCKTKNNISIPSTATGENIVCNQCHQVFKVSKKSSKKTQPSFAQFNSEQMWHLKTQENIASDEPITEQNTHTHTPAQAEHQATIRTNKKSTPLKTQHIPSLGSLLNNIPRDDQKNENILPVTQLPISLSNQISYPKQFSHAPVFELTEEAQSTVNNLVFTLLTTQEQNKIHADIPLLLYDNIEKTEKISAGQQALSEEHARFHQEFNWTLASLVALTVLIVQLFYLMST